MQTHFPSPARWRLRLVTFALAALAAASATVWTLKGMAPPPLLSPGNVIFSETHPADPQAVGRLMGGGPTRAEATPDTVADNAASHFKLTGVVAAHGQGGYALIAIDAQPAKPYRVGARVNDTLVLHSVTPRSAALAASKTAPVSMTLELPKLMKP
jgi:general secretion pathway protein C